MQLHPFQEWEDEDGRDWNVPTPPMSPSALGRRGVKDKGDVEAYLDGYVAFRRAVGPENSRPYVSCGLAYYHHDNYISTSAFNRSYLFLADREPDDSGYNSSSSFCSCCASSSSSSSSSSSPSSAPPSSHDGDDNALSATTTVVTLGEAAAVVGQEDEFGAPTTTGAPTAPTLAGSAFEQETLSRFASDPTSKCVARVLPL